MVLFSFLFCLIGVTGIIGFWAMKKSQKSGADYFLASQSISPYFLALSGGASKFSGFIFVGFMSAAYVKGTLAIWLGVGLLVGFSIVYAPVVRRLQKTNTGGWALSLGELMTFWKGENRVWLRRFIGILTLFFFIIYAAAQLKAGGTVLKVAFDQPTYVGIFLSAIIVLFYCWSGGIRASIWTDVAQIVMMTLSLVLVLVMAIFSAGGVANLIAQFVETAPGTEQVALFPQNLSFGGPLGFVLFFLGAMALGMGILGNPHILIRAMALGKDPGNAKKFIITSYLFDAIFTFLFISAGLCTRVILKELGPIDPELSLFLSAEQIFHPIVVGFFLAGVFASTLSTADSQIISCSSSLMRDLPEPPKSSLFLAKLGTVCVTILATVTALFAKSDVFSLVSLAFAGLGASIGSVLVLRLLNSSIPEWGAILVATSGATAVIMWDVWGLSVYANQALPGFLCAFLTYFIIQSCLKLTALRSCQKIT